MGSREREVPLLSPEWGTRALPAASDTAVLVSGLNPAPLLTQHSLASVGAHWPRKFNSYLIRKYAGLKKFRYHFKYEHLGICLGGESCFTPCVRPSSFHVRGLSWRGNFTGQLPLRYLVFLQVINKSTKPLPFWWSSSFKLLGGSVQQPKALKIMLVCLQANSWFGREGEALVSINASPHFDQPSHCIGH